MIGVGYLAKRVAERPDWLKAPAVKDIYSVSSCTSENFMEYIKFWRHNGYWLFDSAQIIQELARENSLDLESVTFFYYEVYEKEFDEEQKEWLSFEPESFPTNIIQPVKREFHGYDVVTFNVGTNPECSPLSCNHLASEININSHCLFESFEDAKSSLELGKFDRSEPGPFRIFAIYIVDPNDCLDQSPHV
jgi:GH35 family endo-1,4-beta-xylanase